MKGSKMLDYHLTLIKSTESNSYRHIYTSYKAESRYIIIRSFQKNNRERQIETHFEKLKEIRIGSTVTYKC